MAAFPTIRFILILVLMSMPKIIYQRPTASAARALRSSLSLELATRPNSWKSGRAMAKTCAQIYIK
jgi:hypothetical protein